MVHSDLPMLHPNTFALTALLGLLSGLGPLSVDMYLASLPDIGRLLQATPAEVQLTLSIYLIGFAIGQILYGPISDRYGRKPVLLVALAIFSLASIVCAAAPTITTLNVGRGIQALGGSGAIVLARAIVRDIYEGERAGRELSLMGTIMGLAPIVAPLIGGGLQVTFGWRANFIVLVAFGAVAGAVVWFKLPETLPRRAAGTFSLSAILRSFGELLRHPGYRAYLAIIGATYAGLFAWISGAPFVLQDFYKLSPIEFGVAFAVSAVGYMAGTAIGARLVTPLGLDRMIGLGTLALAVSGIWAFGGIALGLHWTVALVAPVALYLAGLGMSTGPAMAGALTPFPERAGAGSSLIGFSQQTGGAIVGALVAHALGFGAWPLVGAIALMGVLAFLAWALTRTVRAHR